MVRRCGGEPAAGRLTFGVLAADRGGEAGEGVGVFDREVRAEGERDAVVEHRAPGIGAAEPLEPHPRLGHQPVRGLVGRLHRGDGAVAGEARQVRRIDDLGMLDPPAPVAGIGGGKLLDRIEQGGVGLIADRVDRDLEIVHRRPAHLVLERGVVDQREAALAGRVAIGCFSQAPREPSAPSR